VLGVDIGGVIVDRVAEGSDTSFFGGRPMETPAVAGAIDCLGTLTGGAFAGRVHLVSKAGPKTADTTRRWLEHVDLFTRTGIARSNVHFVRERVEKAPICDTLSVTHFIDDRIDVLGHLSGVPFRYLFTGGLGQRSAPRSVPRWALAIDDWPTLCRHIVETVG